MTNREILDLGNPLLMGMPNATLMAAARNNLHTLLGLSPFGFPKMSDLPGGVTSGLYANANIPR